MTTRTLTATLALAAAMAAGVAAQKTQINGAGATFPNVIYSKWFALHASCIEYRDQPGRWDPARASGRSPIRQSSSAPPTGR
jgi:hypothetical protein